MTIPVITTKRILLVDDNDMLRAILERRLREKGYAVTPADDGQEAVRQIQDRPCGAFDVVILDYSMPGLTGGEAANLMRRACPDQAVLFLSGYDLPTDLRKGEAFLQKPAMVEDIVEAIERLIRSKRDTLPPTAP